MDKWYKPNSRKSRYIVALVIHTLWILLTVNSVHALEVNDLICNYKEAKTRHQVVEKIQETVPGCENGLNKQCLDNHGLRVIKHLKALHENNNKQDYDRAHDEVCQHLQLAFELDDFQEVMNAFDLIVNLYGDFVRNSEKSTEFKYTYFGNSDYLSYATPKMKKHIKQYLDLMLDYTVSKKLVYWQAITLENFANFEASRRSCDAALHYLKEAKRVIDQGIKDKAWNYAVFYTQEDDYYLKKSILDGYILEGCN